MYVIFKNQYNYEVNKTDGFCNVGCRILLIFYEQIIPIQKAVLAQIC